MDELLKEQGAPLSPWRYAWYAFWVFVGAVVLALFIKGWIDADDVDVSSLPRIGTGIGLRIGANERWNDGENERIT